MLEYGPLFQRIEVRADILKAGDLVPINSTEDGNPSLFAVIKQVAIKDGKVHVQTPVMLDNYNSGSFYEELVYEPDETVVIHQPFRIKETTQ